jgi:hypothetical protein
MCSKHYTRWHKTVGTGFKKRQGAALTEKTCAQCKETKSTAEFYSLGQTYCADCQRSNKRSTYVATNLPLPACFCVECGEKFRPWRRTTYTCSDACSDMRRRRFNRIEAPVSRALRKLAQVEVVDPAVVFDRDDWICQLCHTDIPREAVWPDVMSATMDHIKPLSVGGEHSYANCQASHFKCNASKGAKYHTPTS